MNPQAKALSESFAAGLGMLIQSGDHLVGSMSQAVDTAEQVDGLGAYGSVAGASLRSNTGSHVDTSSVSALAGLICSLNLITFSMG